MDNLFFEDRSGETTRSKAKVQKAWSDKDDALGVTAINRKNLKKLSVTNASSLSTSKFAKKLGRFHQTFQGNFNMSTFQSPDSLISQEPTGSGPTLFSKISSAKPILSISTHPNSSLVAYSEYRSVTIVSPFSSMASFSTKFVDRPYTKCFLPSDEVFSYGNCKSVSITDIGAQKTKLIPSIPGTDVTSWHEIGAGDVPSSLIFLSSAGRLHTIDRRTMKVAYLSPFEKITSFCCNKSSPSLFLGNQFGDVLTLDTRNLNAVVSKHNNGMGRVSKMTHDGLSSLAVGFDSGHLSVFNWNNDSLVQATNFDNICSEISDISFALDGESIMACSYGLPKCLKKYHLASLSCTHVANSVIIPARCRFSKYLSHDTAVIGSDCILYFYKDI